MKRHLVIAPHPDDETLGCGGTLLRARAEGDDIYWLIVTGISEAQGFSAERVTSRAAEIDRVAEAFGFAETIRLDFPTATLDAIPMEELVGAISQAARRIEPTDIYLPHRRDAHSDHAAVFDAAISVSIWVGRAGLRLRNTVRDGFRPVAGFPRLPAQCLRRHI